MADMPIVRPLLKYGRLKSLANNPICACVAGMHAETKCYYA